MKKQFKASVIKIIKINNEDILTIVSGQTNYENELPFVSFGTGSEF